MNGNGGGHGDGSRIEVRIGDAERERAVTLLGDHFAAGRLDRVELDDRLTAAYAAKTAADLSRLFLDLPVSGTPAQRPAAPATFRRRPVPPRFLLPALILLLLVIGHLAGAGAGHGGRGYDGPPPFFLLPMLWIFLVARRRAWR